MRVEQEAEEIQTKIVRVYKKGKSGYIYLPKKWKDRKVLVLLLPKK